MTFPYHLLVGCVVWLLWSASAVGAFEDETHRRINLRAAQAVTSINRLVPFDQFLTDSVGLVQGLNTPFRDVGGATNKDGKINSVLDWLALGGMTEATPLCRPARHFHDPLQPWIGAGLAVNPVINVRCGTSFPASVLWGQSLTQTVGEQRSWFDARASFVNALTGSSQASRDQAWARTFQTLGQLMHLVADASVPEHVRNDTHITAGIFRKVGIPVGSYEWWVEKNLETLLTSTAPRFDPIILRQSTNNAEAPISIARLIDTDTYTGLGSSAGVTLSPAIGLAEFTNANFFHDDRLIVEQVRTEFEKQLLQEQGALVYDVLEIHLLRQDLRYPRRAIPRDLPAR